MGLFDLLFGTNQGLKVSPDKIWLTTEAKFRGVAAEARELAGGDCAAVLLVAHFSDVAELLQGIAEMIAAEAAVPVQAVLADRLTTDLAGSLRLDEAARLELIVAESHPMLSRDEALQNFVRSLRCQARMMYHLSLDDPTLKQFAGDWVREMLRNLGMGEDEAIESRGVMRRIRSAQRKIETSIVNPQPADTAERWMEINLPR